MRFEILNFLNQGRALRFPFPLGPTNHAATPEQSPSFLHKTEFVTVGVSTYWGWGMWESESVFSIRAEMVSILFVVWSRAV